MVWFYGPTTHIWRARRLSQGLNITAAATVWQSSMSAVGVVGKIRAGEKSPTRFLVSRFFFFWPGVHHLQMEVRMRYE